MDKPKITPWNEKNIDQVEELIVFKPTRIDVNDGRGALPYKKGEPVKISGFAKKDLYFQNKILYKKDFDAIVEYEESSKIKTGDAYAVDVSKESSDASLHSVKKGK